jgi:transposase
MVTDAQVVLLRQKLMEKKTQEAAAASAGMSPRSARTWKDGALPSEAKEPRSWRTRPDPFATVWASVIVPLLIADTKRVLDAATLINELDGKHPGEFGVGQVRTLQRRMRDWRAVNGPEREVYFEQQPVVGREAAIDFTHGEELGVTVGGKPFPHLIFEFVLSYSKWLWAELAFGETYEALAQGVQGALWALGGVPAVLRSDNLSAATHELRHSGGRGLTKRFGALLEHYRLRSTRIRPGESHENGIVEQRHYRTKRALAQALVLRGSTDFATADQYRGFVAGVVDAANRGVATALAEERKSLQALPSSPVPGYTAVPSMVRKWSTIRVGRRTYSVPSRLIGHSIIARLHADTVEVYYGDERVLTMPRLRGDCDHAIDYRHVIWSLVRKPGAFARYRYREDLFPSLTFRRAYDSLVERRGDRADVEYVRILHLAASTLEAAVERALDELLATGAAFDFATVKARCAPEVTAYPVVVIGAPDLGAYDRLLAQGAA